MPKYQVEVTLSASGYLGVEADNEDAARKIVQHLDIGLDFHTANFQIDTTMLDPGADIHVDGVQLDEDDTCETPGNAT